MLVGRFTRPGAIVCSGTMADADISVHAPTSLWLVVNAGEPAALLCWSFLTIAVLGAGIWSLDAVGRARP